MYSAHYEGTPDAMRAWLASLGWIEFDAHGVLGGIHSEPTTSAVAAFGPVALHEGTMYALLVLNAHVPLPVGVRVSTIAPAFVGIMAS